jgi:hypothetical protein
MPFWDAADRFFPLVDAFLDAPSVSRPAHALSPS